MSSRLPRICLFLGLLFLLGGLGWRQPLQIVNGAEVLTASLVRVVGYHIGDDIQGHFQLIVHGPSNLTRLEIRFNGTLVHEATSSPLLWNFHTENYPLGWTNMTIAGWDLSDTLYRWTLWKRFVPSDVNTPYWLLAIGFLVIFIIAIIGCKLRQLHPAKKQKNLNCVTTEIIRTQSTSGQHSTLG